VCQFRSPDHRLTAIARFLVRWRRLIGGVLWRVLPLLLCILLGLLLHLFQLVQQLLRALWTPPRGPGPLSGLLLLRALIGRFSRGIIVGVIVLIFVRLLHRLRSGSSGHGSSASIGRKNDALHDRWIFRRSDDHVVEVRSLQQVSEHMVSRSRSELSRYPVPIPRWESFKLNAGFGSNGVQNID
jgi:hypothetical protein